MTTTVMPAAGRTARGWARARGATAALVASLGTVLGLPAVAAADPAPLASGAGLSAPAGVVQTPDGAVWVADPARGVCRVDLAAAPRLVDSPWCAPELPDVAAGALDATSDLPARLGPADPSGLVFDPRTETFYAADRHSSGGAVWRLRWHRASGGIESGEVIAHETDRVAALTLGPPARSGAAPDVYYLVKRSGRIERIPDSATDPQPRQRVGMVAGDEALGMTATDDAVYVADGGVTRYSLSGGLPAAPQRVPGFAGSTVTTVTVDGERDRLYAGTSNLSLDDVVAVLDLASGRVETYEQGFSGVTALGLVADGRLLVADDPIVATGAEGTVGAGRLWSVALQPLNRPTARITAGPPAAGSARAVSFSYASRDGASFECRLNDGPFEACPGSGSGGHSYASLAQGVHRFSVRAVDDGTAGLAASRTFTVDWTAPRLTITPPDGEFFEGGPAPRIHFWADEPAVAFTCSVDGAPYTACWSGNPLDGLSVGRHELLVRGVDAAGNVSDVARVAVDVRDPTPPAVPDPPVPDPPVDPPAPAPQPGDEDQPLRVTVRFRGAARIPRLTFTLRASRDAVALRLSIRDARRHLVVRRTIPVRQAAALQRRLRVRPGADNVLVLQLTRTEQRRLRPGRYRLTAAVRTAAGRTASEKTRSLRVRAGRR